MNRLKLNVGKTKTLLFNKEGLFPNVELSIDGEVIESVRTFKFLGIMLDTALKFQEQRSELHAKLSRASFIIHSLAKYLPKICLRSLYFAYFHSHLTYCISSWYPLITNNQQNTLKVLQKKVVRSICNAHYRDHCMPLFRRERIVTIEDQIKIENVSLVYRLLNRTCPKGIMEYFIFGENLHNTRGIGIKPKKHKLGLVGKSFLCKSVNDWRDMSSELKDKKPERLKSFKKCLKNYLIKQY